jgi:hypothetical protein
LGDGRAIKLCDQESMAIAYLKGQCDEFRAIAKLPGLDAFILGLVYIAKLDSGVTGVALDWDRDLMLLAVDIGITPIHYVTYDQPEEPEKTPDISFCLWGAFDPDEISRKVGVAPSETARAGDTVGKDGMKRKNSLWAFGSRLEASAPVDLHVKDILDRLDNNRLVFKELIREFGGILEIDGLPPDYAPAVSLEAEIVSKMAQYGLRLDIDR